MTIEEYGLQESKKANLSAIEYAETVRPGPGSWLFTEFIADQSYMKALESSFKAFGKDTFKDSEAVEQAVQELEAQYPICGHVFLLIMPVVAGSK